MSLSIKLNYFLSKLCEFKTTGLLLSVVVFTPLASGVQQTADTQPTFSASPISFEQHEVMVESFAQKVSVKVFLPPGYQGAKNVLLPTLYVNDGQDADADAVALAETLQLLYAEGKIRPVIIVAISMLPDRMATYGYSDRSKKISLPAETRYGPVGNKAYEYSEWLALELVPFIDSHYKTMAKPEARAILGWSLGAANAFNIGWNYPDVFATVGGFSSSFWLSENSADTATQLVQKLIASKPLPEHFKLWLAVGLKEETDDRDTDGIFDVMDDAQDAVNALEKKAMQMSDSKSSYDFSVTVFPEGQHNQETWKRMLPIFLQWAYPVKK